MVGLQSVVAIAALLSASAQADTLTIEHDPVGCVVAERYPSIDARISPASEVARARVHFRGAAGQPWYWVEMKPSAGAFIALLPRPMKTLERMEYYVDATSQRFGETRTAEFAPNVVAGENMCGTRRLAMSAATTVSILLGVPLGAPAIPAGFSAAGVITAAGAAGSAGAAGAGATGTGGGGGLGTTAAVVGGAAAAAAGVLVATRSGDEASDGERNFFFEGHVYRNPTAPCRSGSGCSIATPAPGAPAGPHPSSCGPILAGVTVTTSLSAVTATTDSQGYYFIDTGVRESGCGNPGSMNVVLTATAAGCRTTTHDAFLGCHSMATSCLEHISLLCP